MSVAQRLDRRLDDKIRRAEIRLADTEIDDVAALRCKLRGARKHGEGVLLTDTIKGGNGLQHGGIELNCPAKANIRRACCAAILRDALRQNSGLGVRGAVKRPI